jgi:deoxyribose-phosphate aldolase
LAGDPRLIETIVQEVLRRIGPAASRSSCGDCTACGQCVLKHPDAVRNIVDMGASRIGCCPGSMPTDVAPPLASYIDHTLLKPDAVKPDFEKLCAEARKFSFASVCVNPGWVSLCRQLLDGSPVKVCTVIGFPLGATTTQVKAFETRRCILDGATEVDMVINVGRLKSGDNDYVEKDIREVVEQTGPRVLTKVIIETSLLTDEEKIRACLLSKAAGADFVKTSTGFSSGGATAADVRLMRQAVGGKLGVKASGGIRDRRIAEEMVEAGASRIGASASVKIVTETAAAAPAKAVTESAGSAKSQY